MARVNPTDPLESIDIRERTLPRTRIGKVKQTLFNIGEDYEDPRVQFKYYRIMAARYGDGFIISRRQSGNLWSWGCSASSGQLGLGDANPTATPTMIDAGDVEFSRVFATGREHTIALDVSGAPYTWGDNQYGQIGNPLYYYSGIIGAGDLQSSLLDNSGRLWTWGNGLYGNLGDGARVIRSSPVTVVDAGPWARTTNYPDEFGSVCQIPGICTGIGDLPGVAMWAFKEDGSLWMSGRNNYGQLGIGNNVSYSSPVSVYQNDVMTKLGYPFWQCSGGQNTMACIDQNGHVWTWGRGSDGMLGTWGPTTGSPTSALSPINVDLSMLSNPLSVQNVFAGRHKKMISTGGNCIGSLDQYGQGWAWGNGLNGQLGNNNNLNQNGAPVSVIHPVGIVFSQVAAGNSTMLWLDTEGNVWMAGYNDFGRYAQEGDLQQVSVPTAIKGRPHYATMIRSSDSKDVFGFLREDGSLWMWGENDKGQCGIGWVCPNPTSPPCDSGGTNVVTYPSSVIGSGLSYKFVNFWIRTNHTVAIDDTGQMWAWGDNSSGQLGINAGSGVYPSPTMVSLPAVTPGVFPETSPIAVFSGIGGNIYGRAAAAGLGHSLMIDQDDNYLWAWGLNTSGQLGDGTTTDKLSPISISLGGGRRFRKIDAGDIFTMALDQRGQAWGWGNNYYGQLGTTTVPLTDAVAVVGAGTRMGAAIVNGTMWMWGTNSDGQLGDNTRTDKYTPVQVVGGYTWLAQTYVSDLGGVNPCHTSPPGLCKGTGQMADNTSWGIRDDGDGNQSTWTWGWGGNGTLGNGQFNVSYSSPVSVINSGLLNFWQCASADSHMCCIDSNFEVWCWGGNGSSEIGLGYPGSPASFNSPVNLHDAMSDQVSPNFFVTANIKKVATGSLFSIFLDNNGTAYGTGSNNRGQLMVGDAVRRSSPVSVITVETGYIDVAAGSNTTWWITKQGNIYAAGAKSGGLAGFGAGLDTNPTPNIVNGSPHNAIKINTAWEQYVVTGFLRADGSLWMWGHNVYGQLGTGDTTSRTSPTSVLGSGDLYRFVDFQVGADATYAVDENGQVYGWGRNIESGHGAPKSSPEAISGLLGSPIIYQTPASNPVALSAAPNFIDIAAGSQSAHGIDKLGTGWAWGDNTYGQLGDGTVTQRTSPVSVLGRHSFIQITGGGREAEGHTCGLKPDGSVWCWGRNSFGQLGVCDETDRSTPTSVVGRHSFIDVWASKGGYSTIAIKLDGSVWVWGKDPFCDGTDYCSPVSIPDFNLITLNILGRGYLEDHSLYLEY